MVPLLHLIQLLLRDGCNLTHARLHAHLPIQDKAFSLDLLLRFQRLLFAQIYAQQGKMKIIMIVFFFLMISLFIYRRRNHWSSFIDDKIFIFTY